MSAAHGLVPEAPAAPLRPLPPRRVPLWRKIVGGVVGIALVSAAVYAQTFVLTADEKSDPLTVSGGMHDELRTSHFSARLERVEFARTVRVKKQYSTDDAKADETFMIVKVGLTAPRRPTQVTSFVLTADGLRFEPTDRVSLSATLGDKWIQPGWWRSGLFFFDVPADKLAGARVVVAEPKTLFGDDYMPETSFDLGFDRPKARQMAGAAKDVYEVSG
ncbi:hypothetical protein [Sphaerisporangium corydalis]|uniref:DUF4352 domain-containing protein n=1 Tax=Sphaerisporangium corydalis TaxID=1441875 RepID=A0ABV9EM43_9ACTN|nr:hypothetical protein [Sphaerisporangium corydalis]